MAEIVTYPDGTTGPPIMSSKQWRTNAEMIADVATFGFLDGRVLDMTLGEHAGFWKEWQPTELVTNDSSTRQITRLMPLTSLRFWRRPSAPSSSGSRTRGKHGLSLRLTDETVERISVRGRDC